MIVLKTIFYYLFTLIRILVYLLLLPFYLLYAYLREAFFFHALKKGFRKAGLSGEELRLMMEAAGGFRIHRIMKH